MGMFDEIKCKYPLPVAGANGLDYQTKCTDHQSLDHYEIREDGTLWHENYEVRWEKNDKAPLGFYMHRENVRWEHVKTTGEIRFYTTLGKGHGGWIEWSAYFVDGTLSQIHLIKHRP